MRERRTYKNKSRVQKTQVIDDTPTYQCTYCLKVFLREDPFLLHKCELMRREDEIKTPLGQVAWTYYQKWLKTYKKTVDIHNFVNSKRYYRSFMRFADFAQRVHITEIDIFIQMMREKNIPPQLWTNDQIYALFMEYLDHTASPIELGEKTVKFLSQIAEAFDCKVEDVFDQLQPGDVMQFIRERKFTPWLLLRSWRFGRYLQSLDTEEKELFTNLIKKPFWEYKFENNPEIVKWMDTKAKELNI